MLSLIERAQIASHPLARRLFMLMEEKRTNLAVAIDTTCQKKLIELASLLGPEICILKTHVDILEDYTPDLGLALRELADQHRFLIFEDRKFADIGQTVSLQYEKGLYHISEWADLINAHIVPGPGLIDGLKKIGQPLGRGLILIAEMSSFGTLATGSFTKQAIQIGENHRDFVIGFIALGKQSADPGMIHLTPGVKLQPGQDSYGQRYRTIEEVIGQHHTDIIIVGREITQACDPLRMAQIVRQRGWQTWTDLLKKDLNESGFPGKSIVRLNQG
jgi:uridine monophosphate synthetase